MFFTSLVFISAFALELLGSYISILGLSKNASYILVALAITLDFSKIIIATVLYKQWINLHNFLKFFLVPSLLFLVLYTSSGAYAFLLQEFSKTTTGQEQVQTKIEAFEQEKIKLESRKKEIDGQIAQLPSASVVQRKRLTEMFSKEIDHINERTIELDKEIPDLKVKNMADTLQGGTIGSLAKAYGTSPESISKVLVFFMVLVIDPLAIVLLTVANFLVEQRKKDEKEALNRKLEIEALIESENNSIIKNSIPVRDPVYKEAFVRETPKENIVKENIKDDTLPVVSLVTETPKVTEIISDLDSVDPVQIITTPQTIVQVEPIILNDFTSETLDEFSDEEVEEPVSVFDELDSLAHEQEIKEALFGKITPLDSSPAKLNKELSFPPKKNNNFLPENETNDIFSNYEVSDSEVMNLIGNINEKEKGFDTKRVLEEKLF